MSCTLLLVLLWSLVEVHCQQTFPYVSFGLLGYPLADHSYVDLSAVGSAGDDSDSVVCHTDLTTCCSSGQGGDWYFPNGDTLRLLLIASTNFSVFALRILAYTNFSDFLCLHKNSTKVQNSRQNSYAGTGCRHYTMHCLTFEQQVPRTYAHTVYTLYILRMRVRVPRSRVGPRLYLACFTPVAPVTSL